MDLDHRTRRSACSTVTAADSPDDDQRSMTSAQLKRHPDLRPTAYHEAGHAIAALRSGFVVRSVDVVYDGTRFGACNYDCEGAKIDVRALCLLAGGAAERRYTGSRHAYDAGDIDKLGALFKKTLLDPDIPYANRRAGVDAERQRLVNEWYANAETFVEREWKWINRVADALMKRQRLSGDELKQLTTPPVVCVEPSQDERRRSADDEARRRAAVARDEYTRTRAPQTTAAADFSKYDATLFAAAHDRLLVNATSLTDDDIAQFAAVDSRLADRARARRAGFVEADDAEMKKFGRRPVTVKFLLQVFFGDFVVPLLKMQEMYTRQAHARAAALEKQIAQLQSSNGADLEERVKALEQKPFVKFCGIWKAGTAYGPGDAAVHQGGLWICKADTVGEPSKDLAGWQLAVKRGTVERVASRAE